MQLLPLAAVFYEDIGRAHFRLIRVIAAYFLDCLECHDCHVTVKSVSGSITVAQG